MGCRHSSVDSSVPSNLLPWFQVPSTPLQVAQLVDRSLLTAEIFSSNPVISNNLFTVNSFEETKSKGDRPGMTIS